MNSKKIFSCASVLVMSLAIGPSLAWSQVGTGKQTGKAGSATGQGQIGTQSQQGQLGGQGSAGMASSSQDIRTLQQALKDKGLDPGPVNGVMSSKTQEALKTFQQRQGLNATGKLDLQTQSGLGLGSTGSSKSGGPLPGSPSTGTSIEPASPRDPSVKPGEPLPPETPSSQRTSPGNPSSTTGTTPGGSGAMGSGAAGAGATGGGSMGGAGGR